MSTVIRLTRRGRKNKPFYRVVLSESTSPRDGKFIKILGHYDPFSKKLTVNDELVAYYRKNGARLSPVLDRLLNKS